MYPQQQQHPAAMMQAAVPPQFAHQPYPPQQMYAAQNGYGAPDAAFANAMVVPPAYPHNSGEQLISYVQQPGAGEQRTEQASTCNQQQRLAFFFACCLERAEEKG